MQRDNEQRNVPRSKTGCFATECNLGAKDPLNQECCYVGQSKRMKRVDPMVNELRAGAFRARRHGCPRMSGTRALKVAFTDV